jgi:hypothetical protein
LEPSSNTGSGNGPFPLVERAGFGRAVLLVELLPAFDVEFFPESALQASCVTSAATMNAPVRRQVRIGVIEN